MPKKTNFHCMEFLRKVRDEQATALAGKSATEIIAYFSKYTYPELDHNYVPRGNEVQTTLRSKQHPPLLNIRTSDLG